MGIAPPATLTTKARSSRRNVSALGLMPMMPVPCASTVTFDCRESSAASVSVEAGAAPGKQCRGENGERGARRPHYRRRSHSSMAVMNVTGQACSSAGCPVNLPNNSGMARISQPGVAITAARTKETPR